MEELGQRFASQSSNLDEEWVYLMLVARACGISIGTVKEFLLEKQMQKE